MGYVFCYGRCCNCGGLFTFNPMKVPSVQVRGQKEPVCRSCMERANAHRKAAGVEPHFIHPDAYEACDENELPSD
jgi:hypothetical protein